MHEVTLTLAILSPEEEVVAVAVEAFTRRNFDLTHLVASILGSTISDSSPGLELLDAQKSWKEDTEALFPSGSGESSGVEVKREDGQRGHELTAPISFSVWLLSDDARLTFSTMKKVLFSRPAASRAHAFAFKLLFERWERTLISIRAGATSTDSKEFVEWR